MADADNTTELWKDIPEYDGYQASNLGRVRSFWIKTRPFGRRGYLYEIGTESKILKSKTTDRNKLQLRIRHTSGKIRDVFVHRLVLEAFVGPCPPGMVCCHYPDPNPSNCYIENLRWDTQKENVQDARIHGTRKVMSPKQIAEMVQMEENGIPRSEIAARFCVPRPTITKIMKREGRQSPYLGCRKPT